MLKIFKEEAYKLSSRKIIWMGLALLLGFVTWRLFAERGNYTVTIDGQVFYGQEAIDKDRQLTANYAGILTEEKVWQIYDAYGFYRYDAQSGVRIGNFCNRFITEQMTNYRQIDSESPSPEDVQFFQGGDWEDNVAPLLSGNVRFDYTHGWNDLKETFSFLMAMALFVLFIIGLSPVFSEEYMLKTADILLTTQRGKTSGIWMKMAASLFLVAATYCVFTLYIWFLYLLVYGTQGLDASAVLIGVTPYGYCPSSISGFFLYSFALGLAGTVLLAAVTLAVSAFCRNAFLAVVVSMALFFIPYLWMNVLAKMLAPILHMELIKAVSHFMVSMPFYLFANWGFGFSAGQTAGHLCIALAVGVGCAGVGYCRYRGYQG